jgi:hypothetical protein
VICYGIHRLVRGEEYVIRIRDLLEQKRDTPDRTNIKARLFG